MHPLLANAALCSTSTPVTAAYQHADMRWLTEREEGPLTCSACSSCSDMVPTMSR